METTQLSVLVVDDHTIFREAIARMIKSTVRVKRVEMAANGAEALKMIDAGKWDIVLLDIEMPQMTGIQLLMKLRGKEKPYVVILSSHCDVSTVSKAYKLGAKGYLHKDCTAGELITAIHKVADNKNYFSQTIQPVLLEEMIRADRLRPADNELTDREIEVLSMICEQRTSKEIAIALNISMATVNNHRITLLRKTGSTNMLGLLMYAIEYEIVKR